MKICLILKSLVCHLVRVITCNKLGLLYELNVVFPSESSDALIVSSGREILNRILNSSTIAGREGPYS